MLSELMLLVQDPTYAAWFSGIFPALASAFAGLVWLIFKGLERLGGDFDFKYSTGQLIYFALCILFSAFTAINMPTQSVHIFNLILSGIVKPW